MSKKGSPYRVEGQKSTRTWHKIRIYSALAPLGAMQQALADITAASGFTSLRAVRMVHEYVDGKLK